MVILQTLFIYTFYKTWFCRSWKKTFWRCGPPPMDFEVWASIMAAKVPVMIPIIPWSPFPTIPVSWSMAKNVNCPTHIYGFNDDIPSMGKQLCFTWLNLCCVKQTYGFCAQHCGFCVFNFLFGVDILHENLGICITIGAEMTPKTDFVNIEQASFSSEARTHLWSKIPLFIKNLWKNDI